MIDHRPDLVLITPAILAREVEAVRETLNFLNFAGASA